MLHSIYGQSYDNWKIVLIDDMSSPDHKQKVDNVIQRFKSLDSEDKICVHWNAEKKWEMANVLLGISSCDDNDIVCRIDADDWLTDLDALAYIDAIYQHSNAEALWTAHRWAFTDKNISGPMSPDVDVYKHPWVSSHLKTFRKYLINNIAYENFLNMNGDLVRRAGDQCLYLPVLHNAKKFGFIPRVFYHYTIDERDGFVYQTDDAKFQKTEADFIRGRGYVNNGVSWEEALKNNLVKI